MEKNYLEILKKLEQNGFKAYIVGGFVRDKIIGKSTTDIDITTNATPEQINKIFKNTKKTYQEYGAVKLEIENKTIDITTFRREKTYKNGKPNQIEYIDDLIEDLKRRDFTINTICMDKDGKIIDLLNGRKDIEKKLIKTIRPVEIELKEDQTRIIRALRFMSELNFKLSKDLDNYIKENKEEINKINYTKRKQELDKLFKSKKITKFFKYIKQNKLEKNLGVEFEKIKITSETIGIWSQIKTDEKYPFTKKEKQKIKQIKELIDKKNIETYDIYKKGIKITRVAAEILNFDKRKLNLIYTNLPIKGIMDIDIKSNEICEILKIKPGKKLGNILKLLEYKIITGELKNEKEEIKKKLTEIEEI